MSSTFMQTGQMIIVVNAGSSSLKFSVYTIADSELDRLAHGQVEGLGASPRFAAKDHQGKVLADASLAGPEKRIGHAEAFEHVAGWVGDQYGSQYSAAGIGHRIVHGGSKFTAPTLLDADAIAELE